MAETKKQTFADYFNLGKNQYELDFVDVPVDDGDIPLFLDPYAISKRSDPWSTQSHNLIVAFFQKVIDLIRSNNTNNAKYMLSGLREPNQTRFGLSVGRLPRGRGIGSEQAIELHRALSESTAIKTGFIKDLEDCELLIEGIGRDKISDITSNIIRGKLIEYTQNQCALWGIPTNNVPSGAIWNDQSNRWTSDYTELPICNGRSVVLVPKAIARFDLEFNYQEYYQHFVLNFLQAEELRADSSLVRVLKDGTKKEPTKKSLMALHPLTKTYLYEFSKEHPEVLKGYKESKTYNLQEITNEIILALNEKEEVFNFESLANELDNIPPGDEAASRFHNHIIGVLTAVFHPYLINPVKEQEIHEGRKRIDIVFENAAKDGFFLELPQNKRIPSGHIFTECKNYSSDPTNPQLDQLAGRFSVNRGQFGFLICRNIKNKTLFFQRCKDTAQDGRGYIIPLDDSDIKLLLTLRKNRDIRKIDAFLDEQYKKLVM